MAISESHYHFLTFKTLKILTKLAKQQYGHNFFIRPPNEEVKTLYIFKLQKFEKIKYPYFSNLRPNEKVKDTL